MFLLHGFPESAYQWRHSLVALANAGYRAVAPNQRGYSTQARPEAVEDYAVIELVNDVAGMADSLGVEKFHGVGHDWGAIVGWVAAVALQNRAPSLTAVSAPHPVAFAEERMREGSCQSAASRYIDARRAPDRARELLADDAAMLQALHQDLPQEQVNAHMDVLGSEPALDAALHWYRANLDPAAPPPSLPAVGAHTSFIWGDQDPVICREPAEATADYVSGPYRFEALNGVDHWVPERDPARFNRLLLEHLAEHGESGSSPTLRSK